MKPGEGALDNPPGLPQAGTMRDTPPGDQWLDAALPQQATVLVEVVATIGEHPLGQVPRTAPQSAYARDRVKQGNQLRDAMAVSAGQRDRERYPLAVRYHVMLGSGPPSIDRCRPDVISLLESPDVGAIDCAVVHVQHVCSTQLSQQGLVQGRPDPGPRSSPAVGANR